MFANNEEGSTVSSSLFLKSQGLLFCFKAQILIYFIYYRYFLKGKI